MWGLLWFPLLLVIVIAPLWVIARLLTLRREVRHLRRRIDALELGTRETPAVAPAPDIVAETHVAKSVPAPLPARDALSIEQPVPGSTETAPSPARVPKRTPEAPALFEPDPEHIVPRPPGLIRNLEQQLGGLWLQNIGAVLLLLGVFFMILWGYTSGRVGPEVVVVAGVAAGLALAWRGDRMARHVPLLGHTFIGIGLGVVYLSLYLGHFTLRVLPVWLAFGLLTLVSFASIATGIRYGAQAVAALGVVGAFVPQFLATWIPLKGFPMTPAGLIAYLAVVNLVVFGFATRPGWSGLNLAALLLAAFTWTATFTGPTWGWGIEIALATLFALLGLGPVPRLSRTAGMVRPLDLAVVAVAPLCLIAASWPMLAFSDRTAVAALLFLLAALYLLAAQWVDARRPEQDLWRPLSGAATLFLTAALQRAVGSDNTPMAWCVEGALLVTLGLSARGGWLRLCGYFVTAMGVVWMLDALHSARWDHDALPVLYPAGIRDLVCVAAVLAAAWALDRRRELLTPRERFVPQIWTGAGQFLLMLWVGREADHLAYALEGSGGRWQRVPAVTAPAGALRRVSLASALVGAAWLAQASVLLLASQRLGRGFARICGHALSGIAAFVVLTGLTGADGWSNDQFPVLYPAGLVSLAGVLTLAGLAARLARRRPVLVRDERWIPEFWAAVAAALMLAWTAREADHVARAFAGLPGLHGRPQGGVDPTSLARVRVLTATLTSGGWLAQAIAIFVIGWVRDSTFIRWSGLVLFGLTVVKFVLLDLQTVDVFWRFLTAIVVGAVLLAVSYAYQRRNRAVPGG